MVRRFVLIKRKTTRWNCLFICQTNYESSFISLSINLKLMHGIWLVQFNYLYIFESLLWREAFEICKYSLTGKRYFIVCDPLSENCWVFCEYRKVLRLMLPLHTFNARIQIAFHCFQNVCVFLQAWIWSMHIENHHKFHGPWMEINENVTEPYLQELFVLIYCSKFKCLHALYHHINNGFEFGQSKQKIRLTFNWLTHIPSHI